MFSVCSPPPPPPSTLCPSPLQSTCHYIVNHHVKILHVRLGGANNMRPLSWRAQTENLQNFSAGLNLFQERYVGIQFPKIHSTETPEDLSLDDPFSFHLSPLNLSPEEFPVDIEHDSHQVSFCKCCGCNFKIAKLES